MQEVEKTRWGVVAFLFGLGMLGAAQVFKLAPALPDMRQELNLSLFAGGLLFSIINITPALIGVGAGSLVDHFGFRRTLILSLFGLSLSGLLGSLSETAQMILLFRFLEGISVLGIVITAPAMISAISASHQRNLALSIWSSYMPSGAAMMLLLSPVLIENIGWRQLWQLSALISLIMAFVMIFAIKTPSIATHKKTARDLFRRLRDVLSQPVPWLLTLSFMFYTALQAPILAWLPTFLMEDRGTQAVIAGAITALVIFSNVGGTMIGGYLLARGAKAWHLVCFAGAVILIASAGLFMEAVPDYLRLVSCIFVVGLTGVLPTAALTSVPHFAPSQNHVGTLNGMIIQGAQAGHFVGPPLSAWIVHNADGDWSSAWGMYVVFSLMIIGIGIFLRRYSHQA